ncbi:MAG: ABC transporter permease [Clostridium sp.]|nr:MAG: ABC transporter permease [Clostridium sp.]
MVSNNLIVGQVDSGSMAYVLSTSTKRDQVTFTQACYLILSLFLMFVCTTITSIVCLGIVNISSTNLTVGKLILINLGAFLVLFAMSGINFLTSCIFDRSKKSMAIGGGLSMFFLVATMLGLFGSKVIPSVVRIKALNNFNYVTIISFFDAVSIIEGTNAFIWKFVILLVIGIVGYIIGALRFKKKDLPL